jgi:hypothetical protein
MAMYLMLYHVKSVCSWVETLKKWTSSRPDSFALTKIPACSFLLSKKVMHVHMTRCAICYAMVYMPLMSTYEYHLKWVKSYVKSKNI